MGKNLLIISGVSPSKFTALILARINSQSTKGIFKKTYTSPVPNTTQYCIVNKSKSFGCSSFTMVINITAHLLVYKKTRLSSYRILCIWLQSAGIQKRNNSPTIHQNNYFPANERGDEIIPKRCLQYV